tara:strand:- start:27 stop:758 length:732 start_codon:yes stop_codon:yes gene_type:complete
MKKLILFGIYFVVVSCDEKLDENLSFNREISFEESIPKQNILLDENNITIKCSDAMIGETSTIQGKDYTVLNEAQLREMIENDKDVSCVCTSKINDMSSLFENKLNFNQDIGSWDTSNVNNMENMFSLAESFNQDIGNWDTSNVKSMARMFSNTPFNKNIGGWDTSNVINMTGMFYSAYSFNKPIKDWETSNVTNMGFMFSFTLFNQDISDWCVGRISTEPYNFSFLSSLIESNKPVWGSCPD